MTTGRLIGPKMGNGIKCLSQGHSDALPHRELNQGLRSLSIISSATLQLCVHNHFQVKLLFYQY